MADDTTDHPLDTLKASEQSIATADRMQTVSPVSDKVVDENLVVDHTTAKQAQAQNDYDAAEAAVTAAREADHGGA